MGSAALSMSMIILRHVMKENDRSNLIVNAV